jgi:hypothetical protein
MTRLLRSFSPWLVFLLASRFTSLPVAVALGLLASLVVLAWAAAQKQVHLLEVVGLGYFVVLAGVLAIGHPGHSAAWSHYAQLGSHLVLTLVIFGSILANRPFTEAYARETAPPQVWHTQWFRDLNRRISGVWGLAFLAGDVSLALAAAVSDRPGLLRVIVPFGALYLAFRYTARQQAQAAHNGAQPADPQVQ